MLVKNDRFSVSPCFSVSLWFIIFLIPLYNMGGITHIFLYLYISIREDVHYENRRIG